MESGESAQALRQEGGSLPSEMEEDGCCGRGGCSQEPLLPPPAARQSGLLQKLLSLAPQLCPMVMWLLWGARVASGRGMGLWGWGCTGNMVTDSYCDAP